MILIYAHQEEIKINGLYKIDNRGNTNIGPVIYGDNIKSSTRLKIPDIFIALKYLGATKSQEEIELTILYKNKIGNIRVNFHLGDTLELIEEDE